MYASLIYITRCDINDFFKFLILTPLMLLFKNEVSKWANEQTLKTEANAMIIVLTTSLSMLPV